MQTLLNLSNQLSVGISAFWQEWWDFLPRFDLPKF
jgi:hypothetical protein